MTKKWWKAAGIRALKTICQTAVSMLTVGQAVLEVERIRFKWYIRHYLWRALVAWAVGLGVFWLTH